MCDFVETSKKYGIYDKAELECRHLSKKEPKQPIVECLKIYKQHFILKISELKREGMLAKNSGNILKCKEIQQAIEEIHLAIKSLDKRMRNISDSD